MGDFIFKVPKWQGELVFSEEMIMFILTILLVIVGILFCIWGYKYFQTIFLMGIAGVVCYFAYKEVEKMTANRVIQLSLCVSLTFFGLCAVYFISIILNFMLEKMHLKHALVKSSFLFTSVAGGGLVGFTVYYAIYHHVATAAAIGGILCVTGMLIQYKNRKKQIQFRTYNDILKMEMPEEYLAAQKFTEPEPAAETVIAVAGSETEPAVETALAKEIAAPGKSAELLAEPVMTTTAPKRKANISVEPYQTTYGRFGMNAVSVATVGAIVIGVAAVGTVAFLAGRRSGNTARLCKEALA